MKRQSDEIKIVEVEEKDQEKYRKKGHRKNLSLSEIEGNEDLDYTQRRGPSASNAQAFFNKRESRITDDYRVNMLRELVNPHEAVRTGKSGWVGFEIFTVYNDLVTSRNSRIYSSSRSAASTITGRKSKVSSNRINDAGSDHESDNSVEAEDEETRSIYQRSKECTSTDKTGSTLSLPK